jgi:hypothetical protein
VLLKLQAGTGLYVTDFQLVPQAGRLLKIN